MHCARLARRLRRLRVSVVADDLELRFLALEGLTEAGPGQAQTDDGNGGFGHVFSLSCSICVDPPSACLNVRLFLAALSVGIVRPLQRFQQQPLTLCARD